MKHLTKTLTSLFAFVLVITGALCLTACGDKKSESKLYTLTLVTDNETFKCNFTTKKSISSILEENEVDVNYDNSVGFYLDENLTESASANSMYDYSKTIYTKMATLEKININDGVVSAKNSNIAGEVVVPFNATSIQIQDCDINELVLCQNIDTVSAQGLSSCDLLTNIKVLKNEGTRNFYSIDGVLFEDKINIAGDSKLVKYPNNKLGTSYVVPVLDDRLDIIRHVGEYAFTNCSHIKSVDVNGRYVNAHAFYDCDSLENVIGINSGLGAENYVGEYAFANCDNLETVSLTALNGAVNAFNNCAKLRYINLDDNVSYLWFRCTDCVSLEEVVFNGHRIIEAVENCSSPIVYVKIPSNPQDIEICNAFINQYTKQATSDKTGYDMYVRNAE